MTCCQPFFLVSDTSIFSGLTPTIKLPLFFVILLGNEISIPPHLMMPLSILPSNKFIPGLSILDVIFNCGYHETEKLIKQSK